MVTVEKILFPSLPYLVFAKAICSIGRKYLRRYMIPELTHDYLAILGT